MPPDAPHRPPLAVPPDVAPVTTPSVSLRPMAWSLLLSAAVMAAVVAFTFDPATAGALLRHLHPGLLAAAVATVGLRVAFGAWRLRHYSGGRLGWRGATRGQIVWDFFAYVTPSTVGGGPFVTVFLARDQKLPLGEATSLILFAMLVDQVGFALTIPALLVCTLWVDVFPQALSTAGAWALGALFAGYMAWVLLLAWGTLVRPQHLARLVGRAFQWRPLRRFRERAVAAMDDLQGRAQSLRGQSAGFHAAGFAISLVPWLCRYALAVCVIWSVYPAVDRLLVFLRAAALQLGALAVPTPGGAGGVEGLYVLFLGPTMPEALVAPTLLVWRLLSFYLFLAAGFAIVTHHVRWRRSAGAVSGAPSGAALPS